MIEGACVQAPSSFAGDRSAKFTGLAIAAVREDSVGCPYRFDSSYGVVNMHMEIDPVIHGTGYREPRGMIPCLFLSKRRFTWILYIATFAATSTSQILRSAPGVKTGCRPRK
jgi:hypothetical protein